MLIKNGLLWRFIKYRSHKGPQRSMRKGKVASECWQNQNISVPQPLALAAKRNKETYIFSLAVAKCVHAQSSWAPRPTSWQMRFWDSGWIKLFGLSNSVSAKEYEMSSK